MTLKTKLAPLLANRFEPVNVQRSVKFTESELEMLDLMAEDAGQPRNVFIRRLIRQAAQNKGDRNEIQRLKNRTDIYEKRMGSGND